MNHDAECHCTCVCKMGIGAVKMKMPRRINICVSRAQAPIEHLTQPSSIKALISSLAKVGIMLIIFDEDAIPLECSS